MYIHIGGRSVKRSDEIIGIFDMDGKYRAEITMDFLKNAQREGKTSSADDDLPRAFVLTDDEVIFTHISSRAVCLRSKI